MKKIIVILGLLLLIGGSAYTVYDYNKSNKNNTGNTSVKGSISLPEKSDTADKSSSSTSKNVTINSNDKITIETSKIKASDFKLKDLNGKEVSLGDYKGKRVFLNFWASWCGPCRAEMPEMQKLYEETKNSDLVILAVNLGEDKAKIEKFIASNGYNFPVLLDSDLSAANEYNIASIPASFFIDGEGNIVNKHIGSMTMEDMKNYINKIK